MGEILENQARWRETVAEDYPDDVRNTRAADALRGLAAYVRELPADDRRLLRIASAAQGDDMRVAAAGEKWHEVVDRYGFHSQPWPSDGLDIVAAAVEHDAAARREDG